MYFTSINELGAFTQAQLITVCDCGITVTNSDVWVGVEILSNQPTKTDMLWMMADGQASMSFHMTVYQVWDTANGTGRTRWNRIKVG